MSEQERALIKMFRDGKVHVISDRPAPPKKGAVLVELLYDVLRYAAVVARRNVLCRMGIHKMKDRVEVLALGEVLHSPVCEVFGCGHRGEPSLDLPNDDNNGTLIDVVSGKPVGRDRDPNRMKNLGV